MHSLNLKVGIFLHPPILQQAEAVAVGGDIGDSRIEGDVGKRIEAGLAALLGQVGEAVTDGLVGVMVFDHLVVDLHLAGIQAAAAEERFQKLGPAGADQAGNAQYLAAAQVKLDIAQVGFVLGAQLAHREVHILRLVDLRWEAVFQVAADHHVHKLLDGQV